MRLTDAVPTLLTASLCPIALVPSCKSCTLIVAGPPRWWDAALPGPLLGPPPRLWYDAYETPAPPAPVMPIVVAAPWLDADPARRLAEADPGKPAPPLEVREEKWTREPMSNRAVNQASSLEVK